MENFFYLPFSAAMMTDGPDAREIRWMCDDKTVKGEIASDK